MRINHWLKSKKINKIATVSSSFILLVVLGWYVASKVTAQVPPPGTVICAVAPSLCPNTGGGGGGGGGVSPTYTITKEVSAINGDGAKTSGSVKAGDTIKYKIRVKKQVTVP